MPSKVRYCCPSYFEKTPVRTHPGRLQMAQTDSSLTKSSLEPPQTIHPFISRSGMSLHFWQMIFLSGTITPHPVDELYQTQANFTLFSFVFAHFCMAGTTNFEDAIRCLQMMGTEFLFRTTGLFPLEYSMEELPALVTAYSQK